MKGRFPVSRNSNLMQTNLVPPPLVVSEAARTRRRSGGWLLAVMLVLVGGLAWVAIGAVRVFATGPDSRALNAAVLEAVGGDRQPNIHVRVGPVLFTLARVVTAFIPDVPPEARKVLRALRSVEVSIHHLAGADGRVDRAGLLTQADARLAARDWERVVGVVDGDTVVGVYAASGTVSARNLQLCVLVLDGDELITVSARGDAERLAELAWQLRNDGMTAWTR